MRYRKKEIGCEVRYSELDLRAMEYIEEYDMKERATESNVCDEQLQEHFADWHCTEISSGLAKTEKSMIIKKISSDSA